MSGGGGAPGEAGGAPTSEDDAVVEVLAAQGAAGVGRVVDAGARAHGLRGRTVLVGEVDPCGECEVCRRGGAAVCPHARHRTDAAAPRWIARGRWLVPLGDGLDAPLPAAAAIPGDLARAYTLYARTGAGPRDAVVVTGADPVARLLVEVLRAKGLAPVVVADPADAAWVDHLRARGVTVAAEPGADAARGALEATFAAQGLGARPWRVLATTAAGAALGAALCGPRATLTVLAPAPALPGALAAREVVVIGVAGAHPDLVVECAALCAKGELDLAAHTSDAPTADHRSVVTARAG